MEATPGEDLGRRLARSVSTLLRRLLGDGLSSDEAVDKVLTHENLVDLVRPLVWEVMHALERADALAAEKREVAKRAARSSVAQGIVGGQSESTASPKRTSGVDVVLLADSWRELAGKSIDIPKQASVLWYEATVEQLRIRAEFFERMSDSAKARASQLRAAIADITAAGVENLGELVALADRQAGKRHALRVKVA